MDDLPRYRDQFPILKTTTYLISNSLGAMPQRAYQALHAYAETWATRGVRAWQEHWWNLPREVGDQAGALMNAPRGSVIMQPNVTTAHAQLLSCFDFREESRRRKIVADDMHFPSILYLLDQQRARGAEIVTIRTDDGMTIDQSKLLAAIDEQTALVVVSHVLFKSAFIQDVAAIAARAHALGARVLIDGYQSVGTIPVDVRALDVDFYAGGCLKWLCGGPGNAFLYVRPELIGELEPKLVGWFADSHPFDFNQPPLDYLPDIGRFAVGTPAIAALYAAQPGMEIIAGIGLDKIRAKSLRQTARLLQLADELGLPTTTPRDAQLRGGTVAVNVEQGYAISKVLKEREFLVDYRPGAGIRISPHFYTSDDELDAVMQEIRRIRASRAYEKYLTIAKDTVT
ncbi:MAG TPA: aminotransferase class V-fold PLP-dependent enzyme [Anaerolineae bacterium]